MADFVCELKKYRQLKGLTQEQSQYNPSLKLAIDISRAVEAPIEELFIFH